MSKIIPLNNEQHSTLKIKKVTDFTCFKNQHLVPVTAHDFIPLASEFSIVFVKNEDTGQFIAVAMMGIKAGVNLYCQTPEWTASVKPLSFINLPFSLHKKNENDDDCFVCIDIDNTALNTEEGEALFDANGQQSEYLKAKTNNLLDAVGSFEQVNRITEYFVAKKLLTQKMLTINLGEGKDHVMGGIYTIDEQVLNNLSHDEFIDLREKGLLPLIYAQLSSMKQITRLTKKQIEFESK